MLALHHPGHTDLTDLEMINLYYNPSEDGLHEAKSELLHIVELANSLSFSLEFDDPENILAEVHSPDCTHHMDSCQRSGEIDMEFILFLKAAVSSTRKYTDTIRVSLYNFVE